MKLGSLIALAPFLAMTVTAVAAMLAIAVKRNLALINGIAGAGIVISLLLLAPARQQAPAQVTPLLRIDDYALFFIALLLCAGLAVLGLCHDYFKERGGENEELPLLLVTALLGGSVLAASSHFAAFFLGLEILSISLFTLIGYPVNQLRPLEAAIKYLILSGVSSAFLLMGIAFLYAQSGELSFNGMNRFILSQPAMNTVVLSGIVLIVAGLGFKLSLVPFHLWTPDVYEGAPAPVTAFIATVSKGAVFALLLRLFAETGSYAYTPLQPVLGFIAVLSILGGNLLALLQKNVKRLLAYSSIAHMGYLLVAFIAGARIAKPLVVESVGFYLVAYFITTIGAFGVVSVLSSADREAGDIAVYRGLFWRRPWLAGTFTLMLLSLAGIPLTAGFIGKFYIFASGADGKLWGLLAAVIVGSGLGLFYYLRIIVTMSTEEDEGKETELRTMPGEQLSALTLAVLSLLLVWFGILPESLIHSIRAVADIFGK
ncbi:NADH-quinone oxidoreductase subunit N [Methylomicrobium agile]|uniref:NADH-quinone oxidoreductase subunit N n=1 Tax=Methylomicrobium agile TaxID=39774 RepID=UPI0004DF6AC7|nr:NADH-quinone oxidoreductase subunit N [Methylomicrobium agile]